MFTFTLTFSGGARHRLFVAAMVLAALANFPQPSRAADEPQPEVSMRAQPHVTAAQQALALEDWAAAQTAIDRLDAVAAPRSYDAALAGLMRAQMLLSRAGVSREEQAAAIPALEQAIASGFWRRETSLEWTFTLAQLYAQHDRVEQAVTTMEHWLATTPAPTVSGYILVSGSLLELALHGSSTERRSLAQRRSSVDRHAQLERALEFVAAGLRLGTRPDDTLLYIKAACLQWLERLDEAAETLEYLLKLNPQLPERWVQLFRLYINADRELAAVLTMDRARDHGGLDTPDDDIMRGHLLNNLGQERMAMDALEAGLRRGVEQPVKYWLQAAILAYNLREFERARRMLAEAEAHGCDGAQRHMLESLREAITVATVSG